MIKWPQSFTEFMFWILFVLKDCFLWLHEVLQYIFNHNSNEFWKGPFQVCLGHVVDFSYCNDMNNLHHKEAIVKVKKKVKEKPPEVMIFEPKRQEQGEKNPPKISKREFLIKYFDRAQKGFHQMVQKTVPPRNTKSSKVCC